MSARLRAAVIGVGQMGANHARIYADLDGVELVAIAEEDPISRERIAQRLHVRGYASFADLLLYEPLDLVSVVVPTAAHYAVARETLRAGIPTLVEKPIAATVAEGEALIEIARQCQTMLTVGHIERFNPVVGALKRELQRGTLGTIYQMSARRIGPYPGRIKDVGVAVDLASHDLDILHFLTGEQIEHVHATTIRRRPDGHEDLLVAMLQFRNQVVGSLDINWLSPTKVRELTVLGERGMYVANYLTQDLTFYENGSCDDNWQTLKVMGVTEGRVIRQHIPRREPLREEIRAFAEAVRVGGPPPVPPEDALRALHMAHLLIESADHAAPIESIANTHLI